VTTAIATIAVNFPGCSNNGIRRALITVVHDYAAGGYGEMTLADALRARAHYIALTAQGQSALDALLAAI